MATLNNTAQPTQGRAEDKASFWGGLIRLEHGLIAGCVTIAIIGTVIVVGGGYTLLHWWGAF